jgi:FRG domain-containing protein
MAKDRSVKTFKAKSLRQFLKHLNALDKKWRDRKGRSVELWFRGQTDDAIPKPKLYRGGFRSKGADAELRIEFQRRGVQFARDRALSDHWERYFLMQHFGAPTRLLDWTDGALLALYFAVRKEVTEEKTPRQGVVWVLDPFALNKLVMRRNTIALPGWKEVKAWLPKDPLATVQPRFPIAIDPTHVDLRLAVQRSHFTLFGRAKDGLAQLERRHGKRLRLARIVAKGKKRVRRIVEQLEACGIRETSVFPDLEGLSREIADEWSK